MGSFRVLKHQPVGWVERQRNSSPFAETRAIVGRIARPIEWVYAEPDHAMKRRIWPVGDPAHIPMFHRIEMDIVGMPREILFIAQSMLPIAPLQNAAFALLRAARGPALAGRQAAREHRLDQPPPQRKISVAFRQRPDRMQMVRQDDDGFDVERMAPPNMAECLAQQVDVIDEKTQTAVSQIGREEKAAAADKVSPIVRHHASVARLKVMGFAGPVVGTAGLLSRSCSIAPFVGWVERSETHHFAVIAATR